MRRTLHRRRFHTDRIVRNRRARYARESGRWDFEDLRRFSYGALADRDPWDCGGSCWMCHYEKRTWCRSRDERQWRADWL